MNNTKKQLLERIQYLEGNIQGLEEIVSLLNKRIEAGNETQAQVLKEVFQQFPPLITSVVDKRHPGNDTQAKIAKIREYRELFGWGLREAKLFVEVGRIPE